MPYTSIPYVPSSLEVSVVIPPSVDAFLRERGWYQAGSDPRNQEPLFRANGMNDGYYYRWFEAVAYETIGLLRLGHDVR